MTGSRDRDIDTERVWGRVQRSLLQELGDTVHRNWLRPLALERIDGNRAVIVAPTSFMRDHIARQFGDRLRDAWIQASNDAIIDIEIIVPRSCLAAGPDDRAAGVAGASVLALPAAQRGNWTPDDRFTFDNFIVGQPNEFAYAAARRVAERYSSTLNPLFLCGGVGLGKTHLMHAISHEIRERDPSRQVVYLSAEKFMYQFIRALRSKDTVKFKDQFRSVNALMVDDIQYMGSKEATQEEFFHTLNALVDQAQQVVISANKMPVDIDGLQEHLRSRLGSGLVADIHPTTYELRLGIVQAKVEKLGVAFPVNVMEFLAYKITSNVRELEGALNRVAAHSTLVGRDITLESVQEVLHDLLRVNDRRITVEEIQRRVASHYQIRLDDMFSPRRSRSVARPRQVAMYLAKQLTQQSLPDIGRRFGGRDHTTVIHAVKKVNELRLVDPEFDQAVELLFRMLNS